MKSLLVLAGAMLLLNGCGNSGPTYEFRNDGAGLLIWRCNRRTGEICVCLYGPNQPTWQKVLEPNGNAKTKEMGRQARDAKGYTIIEPERTNAQHVLENGKGLTDEEIGLVTGSNAASQSKP